MCVGIVRNPTLATQIYPSSREAGSNVSMVLGWFRDRTSFACVVLRREGQPQAGVQGPRRHAGLRRVGQILPQPAHQVSARQPRIVDQVPGIQRRSPVKIVPGYHMNVPVQQRSAVRQRRAHMACHASPPKPTPLSPARPCAVPLAPPPVTAAGTTRCGWRAARST